MTATSHALIGASIGAALPNPALALPLAFLSHFLCDKVPHWDTMTEKKLKTKTQIIRETILDVMLSLGLVAIIFIGLFHVTNPTTVLLAAFMAQLPDWLEVPYTLFNIKIPVFYENYRVQSWIHHVWFDSRLKAPWGILTQAGIVLIFLVWAAPK